jgi:Nucleotidyl transferase AbiEii toxin, Type IV TA system
MPRRALHIVLSRVLDAFDADLLGKHRFLFGGGTRIALDLDEFRESKDLDFLCSDASSYGDLRLLASSEGYAALLPGAASKGVRFPGRRHACEPKALYAHLSMASPRGAHADLSVDELALAAVAGQPEKVFVGDREQFHFKGSWS